MASLYNPALLLYDGQSLFGHYAMPQLIHNIPHAMRSRLRLVSGLSATTEPCLTADTDRNTCISPHPWRLPATNYDLPAAAPAPYSPFP